eukprot:g1518.t1
MQKQFCNRTFFQPGGMSDGVCALETALGEGDIQAVRRLCLARGVPEKLRLRIWSLLLLGIDKIPPTSTPLPMPSAQSPDQRIITADARRARVECVEKLGNKEVRASFASRIERLLSCFCERRGIRYQQGLHEVLAPLLLLLLSEDAGADTDAEIDSHALLLLDGVCSRFLTTMLLGSADESGAEGGYGASGADHTTMRSMRAALHLLSLLLRYHDRALARRLEAAGFSNAATLFGAQWLSTMHAAGTPLRALLHLWDNFFLHEANMDDFDGVSDNGTSVPNITAVDGENTGKRFQNHLTDDDEQEVDLHCSPHQAVPGNDQDLLRLRMSFASPPSPLVSSDESVDGAPINASRAELPLFVGLAMLRMARTQLLASEDDEDLSNALHRVRFGDLATTEMSEVGNIAAPEGRDERKYSDFELDHNSVHACTDVSQVFNEALRLARATPFAARFLVRGIMQGSIRIIDDSMEATVLTSQRCLVEDEDNGVLGPALRIQPNVVLSHLLSVRCVCRVYWYSDLRHRKPPCATCGAARAALRAAARTGHVAMVYDDTFVGKCDGTNVLHHDHSSDACSTSSGSRGGWAVSLAERLNGRGQGRSGSCAAGGDAASGGTREEHTETGKLIDFGFGQHFEHQDDSPAFPTDDIARGNSSRLTDTKANIAGDDPAKEMEAAMSNAWSSVAGVIRRGTSNVTSRVGAAMQKADRIRSTSSASAGAKIERLVGAVVLRGQSSGSTPECATNAQIRSSA